MPVRRCAGQLYLRETTVEKLETRKEEGRAEFGGGGGQERGARNIR